MSSKSSYTQILKSTSLFGGVQVFQVFSTILRGKIIALFIGSEGMGLSSLFVTSITMLQTISGFGLGFSAMREISQAHESHRPEKLKKVISVFFKLMLFSAIFGALLLLVISPVLSSYTFGNDKYSTDFMWLSIVVLLNAFSLGFQTILQGLRRLRQIALSTVLASLLSLILSFPLYYFMGMSGIVPALIITAVSTAVINILIAKNILHLIGSISISEVIKDGKEMTKLGIARMGTSLLGNMATFLIISFIRNTSSISDVGLYHAGMRISYQYVGIIFAAIAVDYFPRLSAVANDNAKVKEMANNQSEIMMLIVTPILVSMIIFAPILVRIMYSSEFEPIIEFIRLSSIGVYFLAGKQSLDYIPFAKGDKKTFILLTFAGSLSLVLTSIFGFSIGGLEGCALMFAIHCFIGLLLIYFVSKKKYSYAFSSKYGSFLLIGLIIILFVYLSTLVLPVPYKYFVNAILLITSIGYSLFNLDKMIGLKSRITYLMQRD